MTDKKVRDESRLRADRKLDCVGLFCPVPVLNTRIELDKMAPRQVLEVAADDPAAESDIRSLVSRLGHKILSVQREGKTVYIRILKGGRGQLD